MRFIVYSYNVPNGIQDPTYIKIFQLLKIMSRLGILGIPVIITNLDTYRL
jgi:hypothetical protein